MVICHWHWLKTVADNCKLSTLNRSGYDLFLPLYELEKFLGKSWQLGVVAFQASLFFDQSSLAMVLPAIWLTVVLFFFQSYTHIWRA